MAMLTITKDNFETEVANAKLPVVIDFWASWCGPCKMFSPVIEEFAKAVEGEIIVGKINTDEEPELATKYGIMSIPTVILFKEGKVVATSMAKSKEDLEVWAKQ